MNLDVRTQRSCKGFLFIKIMELQVTKGFKVTDKNMQCRGYQFEMGKEFTEKGTLSLCNNGFHFCEKLNSCFNYYSFSSENRVFEIEAIGKVKSEGDKSAALQIRFVRELTWAEVLNMANTGIDNTGHSNSGNWNSGNWNSGDRNSGNWNSGYRNSGNWNSGNCNSGNSNSGNWNSGDSNSGNWNSGNWNSGDRNSGDSNSGYRNSGAFCTESDPLMILFNKPCKTMTVKQWENTDICNLMYSIDPNIWVPASMMSNEEKASHPKWETTEGYLKTIPMKEAWSNFWGNLIAEKKQLFLNLENFDAKIFKEITGIDVNK
jgi:hypothetical protein